MERSMFCAVAIDDVRDVFRAAPELTARLSAVATEAFGGETPHRTGWLAPLMRRHRPTEVDPSVPTSQDMQALLTGAYVAPDRLRPSWRLLAVWLAHLSAASATVDLDRDAWDAVEWELARAGLNSDYALRSLCDRSIGLPLPPLPGAVAGYAKHVHAVEALAALGEAAPRADLAPEGREALARIVDVLRAVAADERLDVVVVGLADPVP
ncbi:MAG: hypothetical protein QM713_12050 [Arachnia sp.]